MSPSPHKVPSYLPTLLIVKQTKKKTELSNFCGLSQNRRRNKKKSLELEFVYLFGFQVVTLDNFAVVLLSLCFLLKKRDVFTLSKNFKLAKTI